MKKYKLLADTDPFLRKKMPVYYGDGSDIKEQLLDLFSFMIDNQGMGLAAPQIGIERNFFIMNTDGKRRCVINPVIVQESDQTCNLVEGCLSFPKKHLNIERPETVLVCYQDENMNYVTEELRGISARCFQHEFDHLNGELFIDYVP